jgi:hypothetical protein
MERLIDKKAPSSREEAVLRDFVQAARAVDRSDEWRRAVRWRQAVLSFVLALEAREACRCIDGARRDRKGTFD